MIYINTTGKVNQVWLPKPYDIVISDCPEAIDAWNSGYTSGYTDGFDDGLESGYTSGYTDGYEDGINSCSGGSCDGIWESGYTSGYTDGAESVDCSEFYESGYTDGYESGSTDGYDSGITAQKAKLTSTAITENGNYTRADGWSAISVNVPVTASTDQDLIANLQGDYFVIPSGTTSLRDYAFYKTCFSSITIPNSVTAIGEYAFASNNCLLEVTVPDSVTSIGVYAFNNDKNLSSVTLSNSITELGEYFFRGCSSLPEIIIPSGVTSIGNNCFDNGYSLLEITIPDAVTSIGRNAFRDCSGLTAMTFEGLVPPTIDMERNTSSLGSSAYTFPIYVPCAAVEDYQSAYTIYAHRITCNSGETMPTAITLNVDSAITDNGEATVTIEPNDGQGNITFSSSDDTVATIDQDGNITVLSSGTVTICAYDSRSGLRDCETISVTKSQNPSGSVGGDITMFYNNSNSTGIPYRLSNEALLNCLTSMYIDGQEVTPTSATTFSPGLHVVDYFVDKTNYQTIPDKAFSGLQEYALIVNPVSGSLNIGENTFGYNDLLTSITLNNVVTLGKSCFAGCHSLSGLVLPDTVTSIGQDAFLGCYPLSTINIPSGVTVIGSGTFRNTGFSSFTIPDTVITVGHMVFSACSNLESVVLGSGITSFGSSNFAGCTALTSVTFNSNLGGSIPYNTFIGCTALQAIAIPSGVTNIGASAFMQTHLTGITLPEGVTTVEDCAFFDSNYITYAEFPSTIQSIGKKCFSTTIPSYYRITAVAPPTINVTPGIETFGQIPSTCPIYVPASAVETYKSDRNFSIYADQIQAIQ